MVQSSMPLPPSSTPDPKGENALRGYWRVYGGWTAAIRSTYLWVSVVLTGLLPDIATAKDGSKLIWPQITLDTIPGPLGLSLGAMALMLSFSSGRFIDAIRQRGRDNSYFRKVMATFFHFALISVLSIVVAIISKVYEHRILSIFGVFCTFYGIMLTMAVVSRIWHTARIFNVVRDGDEPYHEDA